MERKPLRWRVYEFCIRRVEEQRVAKTMSNLHTGLLHYEVIDGGKQTWSTNSGENVGNKSKQGS
jgi:hypothetical protein